MTETTSETTAMPLLGADWSDPIEDGIRSRVRGFIEAIIEEELETVLGRGRYERATEDARGYRNGHREREVVGTFGRETIRVPRARMTGEDGTTAEWRSKALRRYQRLTKRAEALIASVYLAGTNTRRVKRALEAIGRVDQAETTISVKWRDSNFSEIRPERKGAFLRYSGRDWRLTGPVYDLLMAIDAFNGSRGADPMARIAAWGPVQSALAKISGQPVEADQYRSLDGAGRCPHELLPNQRRRRMRPGARASRRRGLGH